VQGKTSRESEQGKQAKEAGFLDRSLTAIRVKLSTGAIFMASLRWEMRSGNASK
jgi:hypothetical protein